jgi:hypothetical protein
MKPSPKPPLPTTTDTNPFTTTLLGEKIQSNITNITNLTTRELSRGNTSFYLSRDLSQSWRQYCKHSGADGCWLIEEALMEYMKNHPLQNVNLSVTQDLRSYTPSRNSEIKLEIAKQELREQVELISKVKQRDPNKIRAFLPKLRRVMRKSVELNYQDEEMVELLEMARKLFR